MRKEHEERAMSERADSADTPGLKCREFLSVSALPLAAALATAKLGSAKAGSTKSGAVNPGTMKLAGPNKMRSTRSAQNIIRIGLIGAGANIRSVQIPGFRQIPGCEIVAVANRSLESSQRVAN
jgi:hypothetical protein